MDRQVNVTTHTDTRIKVLVKQVCRKLEACTEKQLHRRHVGKQEGKRRHVIEERPMPTVTTPLDGEERGERRGESVSVQREVVGTYLLLQRAGVVKGACGSGLASGQCRHNTTCRHMRGRRMVQSSFLLPSKLPAGGSPGG